MAGPLDPFTRIYNALWAGFIAHAPLAELVRETNRINVASADASPFKGGVQNADFPELAITPGPLGLKPHATSSSAAVEVAFNIEIATIELRANRQLWPMVWEVFRAVIAMGDTLLKLSFVKDINVEAPFDVTSMNEEKNRGTPGYSAVARVVVLCFFNKAMEV